MAPDDGARYRFGVFELDARTLELQKSGRAVRVRPQSLRLLTLLLARPGQLVARDEIQRALWDRETFVDFDQGVNHCIKELRAALGDVAEAPRYIQTLPRRGYRFIAPVETVGAPALAPTVPPPPSPAVQSAADESPGGDSTTIPAASATERSGDSRSRGEWLAAIGITALLVGAVMASYAARTGSDPAPRASGLAVLPFSSPSDPALGVGLASAISSRLGGQQLVPVQSVGRSLDGSGDGRPSPDDTGRARGPTLLLDGEISETGSNVMVTARLTDPVTGAAVWSDRFSGGADDLFSVEDVIAERVVNALNLRLAAAEQGRLRRRYTSNAAAYQEYLRGRAALVRYKPEGTLQAVQAFERALQRDPKYALARAGLAMACADMYLRFAKAGEVERWGARAEEEARAALELDPDLAEAHLARATVARKREFDWNATMVAGRRALVLNPNLDQARFFIAAAYYHLGYMEEALIEMEKGRALHGPEVIEPIRIEALVALFSGNFGPARVHLEEVSRLTSQPIGDTYLALAYYYSGNVERGRTMLESLAMHDSASTAARAGAALAGVLAAQGEPAAARLHVDRVVARDYRDHHVMYSIGVAYAQLGQTAEAVRWLRTSADNGFPCPTFFERDPLLSPLRARAEFPELMTYVRTKRDSSLSQAN